MKVVCDRDKLREGLAIANNVVPSKAAKPALENVSVVATDDGLELLGTDLEVSIRYRISDVKVEVPGTTVIPARVTLDFVRDLSGETVTLETSGQTCTITSGADTCELVTIDADEFPVIEHFDPKGSVSLQGGTFTRLINQTAFAAAREPGRFAMHGVLTEIENDVLKLVATDGRRLALSTTPVDAPDLKLEPIVVPTKGMQLFCRVIADPLEQIKLSFGENQVGLKTEHAEIFARLIEGEFPRYAAVVPAEATNVMEADCALLSKKLRLVANVTGEEARGVKIKLQKNQLELFGQSVGRGEATAHMEVDFTGAEAEIAFNPDYVIEGLKNCETDVLRLEFNEKTSPGKFCLGENYIYIVMPITINV